MGQRLSILTTKKSLLLKECGDYIAVYKKYNE